MPHRRRRWRPFRRIERAVLGAVFGFAAFVIERRVLRAIKRGGESRTMPKPGTSGPPGRDSLVVSPQKIED